MPVTRHIRGMYKPFLVDAIRLEHDVQDILDVWEVDNNRTITKYATSSGIRDLQKLQKGLMNIMMFYLAMYDTAMHNGVSRIIRTKAKQCLNESLPLLKMIGDTRSIFLFSRDMKNLPDRYRKWSHVPSGKYDLSFTDRVKAVTVSTSRTIKNILALCNKKGYGAKDLVSILKDYVNPNTKAEKPFDIARKALGASKSFRPNGVLSGSVQTNLYSITRNQAAELWRNLTDDIYRDADWVKGYTWELSGSHIKSGCVCEDYAKHGVYPKSHPRPQSHGNCLCDWVPDIITFDEAKRLMNKHGTLYNYKK